MRATHLPGAAKTDFWLVRWEGDEVRAAQSYPVYSALKGEDIAAPIHFAVTMPAHVDATKLELMQHQQVRGRILYCG